MNSFDVYFKAQYTPFYNNIKLNFCRFICLLEYAEEVLKCKDIIVCMKKDRADRGILTIEFKLVSQNAYV